MKDATALLIFLIMSSPVCNNPTKREGDAYEGPYPLPCCEDIEAEQETECKKGVVWKVFLGIFIFIILLILLGCIKGSLGLCCPYVGIWGLDTMTGQQRTICCYQMQLVGHPVICDCHGISSCPDSNDHTGHIYNRTTIFCLNIIFFLAYPFALCCKHREKEDDKGLCVPGCNPEKCYGSQLEEDDVRFVLEQLKLSRDSLRRCACDAADQTPLIADCKENCARDSNCKDLGNDGFIDREGVHQNTKCGMGHCCLGSMDCIPPHSDLSNDVDQYELLEQKRMEQLHYEQ